MFMPMVQGGHDVNVYKIGAVHFDGTNDHGKLYSAMTGLSNGKELTMSYWIKMGAGSDGSAMEASMCNFPATNRGYINERKADNKLRHYGSQTNSSTSIEITTSNTITESSGWTHVMFSYRLASTPLIHFYVNNVDVKTVQTSNNTNVDFVASEAQHELGSVRGAQAKFKGDMADHWFTTTYIDLSDANQRAKFVVPNSIKPVDLGADGSIPTGSQPLVFFHHNIGEDASDFVTNRGSAQNYVEVGELTESSSIPTD
tara:strand:+ start:401 stop:1171 length:771 start_codon:yes stop_codon:yes gene_type:complete